MWHLLHVPVKSNHRQTGRHFSTWTWHVQCHSMGSHVVYIWCVYGIQYCLHLLCLWDPIMFISAMSLGPLLFTIAVYMGSNIVYIYCVYGISYCLYLLCLWDAYCLHLLCIWDPILFIFAVSLGSHVVYICCVYGIPYCGTEHVMSMCWNICLMMVTFNWNMWQTLHYWI
jgi:hypothetical protein